MKILFIGAVQFSKHALILTIQSRADVVGVCTLSESLFNSDHCDLSSVAESYEIPVHYAKNINSSETVNWINDKEPDIIFCFGWSCFGCCVGSCIGGSCVGSRYWSICLTRSLSTLPNLWRISSSISFDDLIILGLVIM